MSVVVTLMTLPQQWTEHITTNKQNYVTKLQLKQSKYSGFKQ